MDKRKKVQGGLKRLYEEMPPFITKDSIKFIENNIKDTDNVLEFGAGGSTVYFAKHAKKVVSFESGGYIVRPRKLPRSVEWYSAVVKFLEQKKLNNVELYLLQAYPESGVLYERIINSFPDEYFNWVFIDGANRKLCLDITRKKLASGGYMVIDNYDHIPPPNGVTSMKVLMKYEYIGDCLDEYLKGWESKYFDEEGWAGKGTVIFKKP